MAFSGRATSMSFFLWVILYPWTIGRFPRFVGRLSVDLAPSRTLRLRRIGLRLSDDYGRTSDDYRMIPPRPDPSRIDGLHQLIDGLSIDYENGPLTITSDRFTIS